MLMSVAPVIAGAMVFGCGPSCWIASGWMASGWVLRSAWAQSGPQAGSLLGGAHPAPEPPMKPPSAAPRQPVHQEGPVRKTPPVVPPHGPTHPHKPRPAASANAPAPAPAPAPAKSAPPEAPPPTAPSAPTTPTAEKPSEPENEGGRKLPRFASLRADEVNMRAGPGLRYRIDWVYKRRDLPVEILREYDVWRWVRDPDGIEGWMQQATLMGRRSFIVQKADATLRSEPNDTAAAVAILKPGVIGRIRSCEAASAWCNVQTGSYRGYLRREQFWGVFPGEAISP
jgi:SH3-like domain-containing protein